MTAGVPPALSPRQQLVLDYISQSLVDGRCPSLDAVAGAVGIASRGAAHRLVQELIAKGYLRRDHGVPGRTNSYTVLRAFDHQVRAFADVLAGIPTDAIRAELDRRQEATHG